MRLLVGTYTRGTGSKGIYLLDTASGSLSLAASLDNPSFLVRHPSLPVIYAVNEHADGDDGGGEVCALAFDGSQLTVFSQVVSGGADPCHLEIDPAGRFLVVSNYSGGTLAAIALDETGALLDARQQFAFAGAGPVASRQASSHVHAARLTGDALLATDLGDDSLIRWQLDADGRLVDQAHLALPPGCGPRHIALDRTGAVAFVITELANTILRVDLRDWQVTGEWSTLPDGYRGRSFCAEIQAAPDGRFLYGSNRGDDSLAVFAVTGDTLTLSQHEASGGGHPRHFLVSNEQVHVANRDSNNVVVFNRNEEDGRLTDTGVRFDVPAPVCLVQI